MSAASVVNNLSDLGERVRSRIAQVNASVPDTIVEMMHFQFVSCEHDDIVMTCQTMPWMRNPAGTLHGGLCATILDQAMGFVSYCLKDGEGSAPAVHLSVNYHRPLHPGERVIVKVHVVSATRSLMNLTAEAYQESCPEKVCLSGSGMYYHKVDSNVLRTHEFL